MRRRILREYVEPTPRLTAFLRTRPYVKPIGYRSALIRGLVRRDECLENPDLMIIGGLRTSRSKMPVAPLVVLDGLSHLSNGGLDLVF